jgi:HK97 family phage major capsid protein
MAMTVKQLQEERAPIGAEIRKMADTLGKDKPDFTAEERSKWDKLNDDFNRLTSQIGVARRAEEVNAELNSRRDNPPGAEDTDPARPGPGKRKKGDAEHLRAVAFQAWCRRQHGMDLTREHRDACKRVGLNPNRRSLTIDLPRRPMVTRKQLRAAQSDVTGSLGAYTVPQGFVYNLEKAMKAYNGCRQVADIMRTDTGNSLPWPNTNDTGNVGELIAENTTVAQVAVPFNVVTFGAYKFSSKMLLVPSELLDDTAFNLNDELSSLLGERIGRAQESYFTTGTGSGQPQGLITGATLGKTTALATAIAPDEIIDLIHSVDPAYRNDPSFRMMMHDLILAYVRKLKDAQGRYLFEEGQGGAPDRVKGVTLAINQNMASTVATTNKTIAVGAMKKFKIRDVKQIRMRRLEERYADSDQVGFIGFMRSDSKVVDAGTNPIKYLQQA